MKYCTIYLLEAAQCDHKTVQWRVGVLLLFLHLEPLGHLTKRTTLLNLHLCVLVSLIRKMVVYSCQYLVDNSFQSKHVRGDGGSTILYIYTVPARYRPLFGLGYYSSIGDISSRYGTY